MAATPDGETGDGPGGGGDGANGGAWRNQPRDEEGRWTDLGGGASVTSVAYSDRLPPDALDPVVVTKEDGTPLTNPSAPNPDKPIMRPKGFPPEVFITKGEVISDLRNMKPDNTFAADLMLLRDLSRFKHGGPLEMQRLTGEFDTKYVDYATIAIGLHNAAARCQSFDTEFICTRVFNLSGRDANER